MKFWNKFTAQGKASFVFWLLMVALAVLMFLVPITVWYVTASILFYPFVCFFTSSLDSFLLSVFEEEKEDAV